MAAMEFTLEWQSEQAKHTDCLVAEKLSLRRDILPPALEQKLLSCPVGYSTQQVFRAGELLADWGAGHHLRLPPAAFHKGLRRHRQVEPKLGRFYPQAFIAGTHDISPENTLPFRITSLNGDLGADLNHPLAGKAISVRTRILDIWEADDEHGGRCCDVAELLTTNGVGMQARWQNVPTDFFTDQPFARLADETDAAFYAEPRLVDHIDRIATAQISALYGRLMSPGSAVLDLMSSWKSHLPDHVAPGKLVGLGMNRKELDANPRLDQGLVHDLNRDPQLPFSGSYFDAIVCTVSVEYLTNPLAVFAEANRVLKSGGLFVLTFSNRWFPPKVISAWQACHEFERLGLVLEYFLRSGGYCDLETFSLRGLPRPGDDKYADQLALSDPVYAVWGYKA